MRCFQHNSADLKGNKDKCVDFRDQVIAANRFLRKLRINLHSKSQRFRPIRVFQIFKNYDYEKETLYSIDTYAFGVGGTSSR